MSLWDRIRCSKDVLAATTPIEKRKAALGLLRDSNFVGPSRVEVASVEKGLKEDLIWHTLQARGAIAVWGRAAARLTYQRSGRSHSETNECDEVLYFTADENGNATLQFRGSEVYSNSIDVTIKLSRIAMKNLITAIEQSGALERGQLPVWEREP